MRLRSAGLPMRNGKCSMINDHSYPSSRGARACDAQQPREDPGSIPCSWSQCMRKSETVLSTDEGRPIFLNR